MSKTFIEINEENGVLFTNYGAEPQQVSEMIYCALIENSMLDVISSAIITKLTESEYTKNLRPLLLAERDRIILTNRQTEEN